MRRTYLESSGHNSASNNIGAYFRTPMDSSFEQQETEGLCNSSAWILFNRHLTAACCIAPGTAAAALRRLVHFFGLGALKTRTDFPGFPISVGWITSFCRNNLVVQFCEKLCKIDGVQGHAVQGSFWSSTDHTMWMVCMDAQWKSGARRPKDRPFSIIFGRVAFEFRWCPCYRHTVSMTHVRMRVWWHKAWLYMVCLCYLRPCTLIDKKYRRE